MSGSRRARPVVARSAATAGVVLLLCLRALADSPWEKYHVTYGRELRTALQGTIGVLTIGNQPGRTGTHVQTYYRLGDRFEPGRRLSVLAATIPVSSFSYHPPMDFEEIGSYRYPIARRCSSYVEIVYDPVDNWRAWVDLRELEEDFATRVVMLESLAAIEPGDFFLDVFSLTPERSCRLYADPDTAAGSRVISAQDSAGYLLRVLAVRGGFARVANYLPDLDNQLAAPEVVPLGWVRIWDDEGTLLVWIRKEDLC